MSRGTPTRSFKYVSEATTSLLTPPGGRARAVVSGRFQGAAWVEPPLHTLTERSRRLVNGIIEGASVREEGVADPAEHHVHCWHHAVVRDRVRIGERCHDWRHALLAGAPRGEPRDRGVVMNQPLRRLSPRRTLVVPAPVRLKRPRRERQVLEGRGDRGGSGSGSEWRAAAVGRVDRVAACERSGGVCWCLLSYLTQSPDFPSSESAKACASSPQPPSCGGRS